MIWYVAYDLETGELLRFGTCPADDVQIQTQAVVGFMGNIVRPECGVLVFEEDPAVTDVSHRVDVVTRALVERG